MKLQYIPSQILLTVILLHKLFLRIVFRVLSSNSSNTVIPNDTRGGLYSRVGNTWRQKSGTEAFHNSGDAPIVKLEDDNNVFFISLFPFFLLIVPPFVPGKQISLLNKSNGAILKSFSPSSHYH